jgi:hypothetical protein
MVKLRKATITAMMILVLVACGDGNSPTGGADSGSGDNTATTAGDGYN